MGKLRAVLLFLILPAFLGLVVILGAAAISVEYGVYEPQGFSSKSP